MMRFQGYKGSVNICREEKTEHGEEGRELQCWPLVFPCREKDTQEDI